VGSQQYGEQVVLRCIQPRSAICVIYFAKSRQTGGLFAEVQMEMSALDPQQHAAFLRLFTETEGALRVFVRSLLPTAQDAAEVLQEVAVVLWEKFDRFDGERSFRAWAFGIARYQALMFLRKARTDRHVFDDALAERMADAAEAHAAVHDVQRDALERCLRRLQPGQRALVMEAYAPGVRIDQMATLRGQSPMSLYKALHRIRLLLMDCVRGEFEKETL
jgi:RNA polymerase sigma-70 factor (ECF subfamily)